MQWARNVFSCSYMQWARNVFSCSYMQWARNVFSLRWELNCYTLFRTTPGVTGFRTSSEPLSLKPNSVATVVEVKPITDLSKLKFPQLFVLSEYSVHRKPPISFCSLLISIIALHVCFMYTSTNNLVTEYRSHVCVRSMNMQAAELAVTELIN